MKLSENGYEPTETTKAPLAKGWCTCKRGTCNGLSSLGTHENCWLAWDTLKARAVEAEDAGPQDENKRTPPLTYKPAPLQKGSRPMTNAERKQAIADVCNAVPTTDEILADAARTFKERNAVYGSNYKMVGPIMAVLFPNGAPPELLHDDSFHLFELIVVKLSRLAISNLTHIDSAHDMAVYAAMIEHNQRSKEENK